MNKYAIIEPQSFKLDGGAMFGIIPKPLWNKVHPADEENRIELALRLILIKKNNRLILIDTGIGDYHDQKFNQRFAVKGLNSPLVIALNSININPDDVTDLIISHLHFDHVGGLIHTESKEPVLKNATIHLHRAHYEYSQNPTEKDQGSFHSHSFKPTIEFFDKNKKVNWLSGEEGEIVSGIKFLVSHGHTPYLIHPYDEKFIYLADLIPTSNHVHIPWVMAYDVSPGITTQDKRRILKFVSDHDLLIIYEHDPVYFGSKVKLNSRNDFEPHELLKSEEKLAYWIKD